MTEDDARDQVRALVPRETFAALEILTEAIREENGRQNLISSHSVDHIWARHVHDSAQLATLAVPTGTWLDIGSGAGFPGLVIAAMRDAPAFLVEPRAKRAAFLDHCVDLMDLRHRATIMPRRIETVTLKTPVAVISARAVAPLTKLFDMAVQHADADTMWLLPKGRTAAMEVAEAERRWHGDIRLAPSATDPESAIVVARGVRRKTA